MYNSSRLAGIRVLLFEGMARYVGFFLPFLLACISFAFAHGNPYNLNGNKTDACFLPSRKATAECLQELIESYYGKSFSTYCPEFSNILAESRCRGCPWDRLDPKKINPDIAVEYRATTNKTDLFHEPHGNCSASKYVRRFATYGGIVEYAARWAFLGSIPLFFSTGSIVQSTSDYNGLTRPSFLGGKVREWVFMGAVWISFNIGTVLLSISEEYYAYCDLAASNIALVITRYLSYLVLIYYSLRRSRLLCFPQTESNRGPQPEIQIATRRSIPSLNASNETKHNCNSNKSWHTFVWDKEGMPRRKYIRIRKAIATVVVYVSSVAVLTICIFEMYGVRFINYLEDPCSLCTLSVADTSARVIEIVKLSLEPLVYIVYSVGASTRSRIVYLIRYIVLALIAWLCVTITVLTNSKSLSRPHGLSFLVWGVPLVTRELTELAHVLAVSIFGLLEPLRYGSIYPQQADHGSEPVIEKSI